VNEPDPDIIEVLLLQSQKVLKEVLSTKNGKRKYKKMADEDRRKRLDGSKVHRSNLTTGSDLLMKCVPGTKKSNGPEILVSTVNYIRELENYIRELEECIEKKINYTRLFSPSTTLDSYPVPSTCIEQDSGPRNSTLHYYPVPSTCMEQESDSILDCYIVPSTAMDKHSKRTPIVTGPSTPIAEYSGGPSSPMVTGPSSPMVTTPSSPMAEGPSTTMTELTGLTTELAELTVLSSLMAEYSDISVPNSPIVTGPTTQLAELTGPSSPMAEYSDISGPSSPTAEGPSTTMDDHSTDAIAVPVEITELTSSDEIAQWVGVNLNSDEEEEELPEFNSVEELSQWLGI
jgi:hypothetical protein